MALGLVLLNGDSKGTVYRIEEGREYAVGRDASCAIVLADKTVSKRHAEITSQAGKLSVRDLGSHNGTFVNGQPAEPRPLIEGDTITVGLSVFRVSTVTPNADSSPNLTTSIFTSKPVVDVQPPVPKHPASGDSSPRLLEYTRKMQEILNRHTDSVVKESLKILFNILPVSRLSIFNVEENRTISQGYTVLRKAGVNASHMSQSFAQQVLEKGTSIIIKDTSDLMLNDKNNSIGFLHVRCIIGVPITLQGKPRAVLLGDNLEESNLFTDEHLRIMQFASKAIEVLHQRDAIYKLDNMGKFLPICSYCKKIRDDGGYWNQLEAFITKRADVAFSHGCCPECYEKALKAEMDSP